jgi:hypothetical protein
MIEYRLFSHEGSPCMYPMDEPDEGYPYAGRTLREANLLLTAGEFAALIYLGSPRDWRIDDTQDYPLHYVRRGISCVMSMVVEGDEPTETLHAATLPSGERLAVTRFHGTPFKDVWHRPPTEEGLKFFIERMNLVFVK